MSLAVSGPEKFSLASMFNGMVSQSFSCPETQIYFLSIFNVVFEIFQNVLIFNVLFVVYYIHKRISPSKCVKLCPSNGISNQKLKTNCLNTACDI